MTQGEQLRKILAARKELGPEPEVSKQATLPLLSQLALAVSLTFRCLPHQTVPDACVSLGDGKPKAEQLFSRRVLR